MDWVLWPMEALVLEIGGLLFNSKKAQSLWLGLHQLEIEDIRSLMMYFTVYVKPLCIHEPYYEV